MAKQLKHKHRERKKTYQNKLAHHKASKTSRKKRQRLAGAIKRRHLLRVRAKETSKMHRRPRLRRLRRKKNSAARSRTRTAGISRSHRNTGPRWRKPSRRKRAK